MVAPVITTALQGAMAATSAFNMIGKTKDAAQAAGQTLKTANDFTNTLASQNSLTDIVKMTRVEPETLIDQSCLHIEYLPDILQTTLNIFTGYYLQALSLLGTVNSTKVIRTLGALNPTAPDFFSMESYSEGAYKSALESYEFCLPRSNSTFALESNAVAPAGNRQAPRQNSQAHNPRTTNNQYRTASAAPRLNELTRELSNLAVGKLINVSLSDSDNSDSKVTIPVTVRLATSVVPGGVLTALMSANKTEDTVVERFHSWRAGRIAFWKDLVMCQDMIDNRKKLLLGDKSGTYQRILRNANNQRLAGLTSDKTPAAQSSNIVVMSEATAREIEQKSGFQFKNPNSRAKLFEAGYMMLIVIIDPQYERVTFYHRGVAAPTNVGVRDIKMSNKNGGPDVTDIMKMLLQGNAVNI